MAQYRSSERHPFTSLLILLLLIIAGVVIFSLIALAVSVTLYGLNPVLDIATGKAIGSINFLKIFQISTSIGMFIIPALVFARIESKNWLGYLKLNAAFPFLLVAITFLLMFASAPLLEYSVELNRAMKLPEFLKGLEIWMKNKEDEMAKLTMQLLDMKTIPVLALNLFMLAIIPAVGEELTFRACLQKIFGKMFGNHHMAIWLTAIIFSAIHIQFYGFIPRMLLGALFGYLFFWSKSIWLPILAHFVNNGTAVVTAYVYQRKGIPLDNLEVGTPSPSYIYLISFVGTAVLIWLFYKVAANSHVDKNIDGKRLE
ncbi:MAG: Abortive infection protein [Sphingobacteriales bacterium]|nr:Abortive infection protein [Sphingobacteriales bacterium]